MASDDTVLARLVRIFTERLALEVPAADTDLLEAGVLDSLSFANLLVCVEAEFDIRIPLEELDLDRFRTLRALGHVVRHAAAAGAGPLAHAP
ncbi:MAG TPA: phosphopantetheine-binding protein [Methylomirabilota bacterium]